MASDFSETDVESTQTAAHQHKRTAVRVSGTALMVMSFQTLGIIYSDIGTSPLYVLNGIWPADGPVPSKEDVIGGISAIIWSLTILPLIKYVYVCLYFGTNEGEGGTYALFQGLYPEKERDFDADRTLTGDSYKKFDDESRSRAPSRLWLPLLILSLFGTSLTLADGVFTPAVSVTSAVGGIAVAKPSVANDITGISIAFLVALFLIQSWGTSILGYIFAPITFVWFALIAVTGIVNITHFPGIFRAFDPSRAIMLFVRTREYDLLAGILLCITGCEALFANLGQFNVLSIQISFTFFVYPSLILAYLGQGAKLIVDGEAVLPNIFYNTIPGPHNGALYWIVFVVALLATLIASQALITATFSLVQQLINMRNIPALHMVYTSETVQGQIYVPMINWILMAIIIIVIAAFNNTTALTNAYGFAVATVMLSTTCLIAFQCKYVKGYPFIAGVVFFFTFGFFDALFWGAALKKIPHGAWVPLMIGIIILSTILFWTWAKRLETKFDGSTRRNLRHIIFHKDIGDDGSSTQAHDDDEASSSELDPEKRLGLGGVDSGIHLAVQSYIPSRASHDSHGATQQYYIAEPESEKAKVELGEDVGTGSIPLARVQTCAIFHKPSEGRGVPHSFISFVRQWPALPRVVIFLSARTLNVARIPPSERYTVTKVRSIQGFYGVTYYLGFRDEFDVKVEEIIERIAALDRSAGASEADISEVRAVASRYTHIVPYYMIKSKPVHLFSHPAANASPGLRGKVAGLLDTGLSIARRFLLESVYYRISTMFPDSSNWLGSSDDVIHVGVNAYI